MSHTPSAAGAPAPTHEVEVLRDVRIPTGEPGVTLAADLHLPAGAGPVPALVMATPYRKDASIGAEQEPHLRWFAARGYACLLFDFRGLGSSDGTARAPFDATEADDGVAAVEWAARQPWCDGNVGMWGVSYGSLMTMRTAIRRPAGLKAIMPVMGPPDPERDFVHPHGVRGAQAPIPYWAMHMLASQLLPPLRGFHDAEEQRRWRGRLQEEPWALDLLRHGPGDPIWRERALDPAEIDLPALNVAGWWDVFRDGQLVAYERMRGPKQLLLGPWMHTMPQGSPFRRTPFLPIALRWWDHWLRGVDDGLLDEPPVRLWVQGHEAGWREFDAWPPAEGELALALGADDAGETGVVEHRPDPTVGAQSGLWGLVGQQFGHPLDQHEDDRRSASATSEPLPEDLLLAGRARVTVRTGDGAAPARLAVRLCDVAPDGSSALVSWGVAEGSAEVALAPAAHRVRAGHRLRVAVGDADFPRLWPAAAGPALRIAGVELRAQTASEDAGAAVELPSQDAPDPATTNTGLWGEPIWEIARRPVDDELVVRIGVAGAMLTAGGAERLELRQQVRASVRRAAPEAATFTGEEVQVAHLATGEVLEVEVTCRLTETALRLQGTVRVDGTAVYENEWDGVR
jgi:putative CocE/NonD family hydrolase